ncbi:lateral flagellin LafA [Vibrio parahaemolyticus]|uniref:lateral flagellin LafA n=2 Tax=Vibrio parahaemolyticus TaxID=670 RepID=UPI00031EE92B|nr:lateral flagellin LafA [Vibrio parahaemolyticus]KCV73775.1 Lateral flagellin [Vibrio parahaemolyticus VP49]ANQ59047.1 Lateral flagellin [Vibrio parahaemolyticus]ANZ13022.1 lateral flagellin LafA [Vibrio parahaemolyticus]ASO14266.1 Lateral flagellin [Vibrio parahaemolyticus]AWA92125.1 Lateral flagellin [Vibrio parahaemolyticus]
MALSMHTNYASLVTQNTLNSTSGLLNTAMERLSTGYRINSAADDAAGLQIATRLEAQTRGMNVAMRNAQDGISMMQTAEGAMEEMTNITYRMNDLATQSLNGSNSAEDRVAMDAEFKQLASELGNIMGNTSFGGQKLLAEGGGFGASSVSYQIGATGAEKLAVNAKTELNGISTAIAGLTSISTAAAASTALSKLSSTGGMLAKLGTARAEFGANINRLEHTMTNLGNMTENTSAAKGRIMEADFAVESSNMTKNQMLMQAGTTVLSKTNQLPGMAMSLLR